MSKYIPVEAEKWAQMVQAMALAADLMAENKRLASENERLRKAGDAMAHWIDHQYHKDGYPFVEGWDAAKEGCAK